MKVKLDEKGSAVLDNGIPVWVADDGNEIAYDVPRLINDLSRVNGESAGRRKEIDELKAKLGLFEGLDAEKAKSALETVSNLEAGKLIDAGKVDELKAQIQKNFESRLETMAKASAQAKEEAEARIKAKDASIRDLLVRSAFESSAFLKEKTVLPADLAYASFGHNFEVVEEDGKMRLSGKLNGQPLFATNGTMAPATPEEAIKQIIEAYPLKNNILKTVSGGSGTQTGSAGALRPNGKMTPEEAGKLSPEDYAKARQEHRI